MDWAVRDERSPTGWVFGTSMYNGNMVDRDVSDEGLCPGLEVHTEPQMQPWDRLTPVGVQWGNDPQLTQKAFESDDCPQERWINPVANNLRESLGGKRPFWGWNGRLNGPGDSSCVVRLRTGR
jgi:hypothetical protein